MSATWIRRTAGVLIGIATATCGGVAFAATSAPGTDDAPETVELSATLGAGDLFPGFTGGDISAAVDNGTTESVHFTSLVGGSITSSDETSCSSEFVTVAALAVVDVVSPAHSTTSIVLTDVVTMLAEAPDGCQGVSFTITVVLAPAMF